MRTAAIALTLALLAASTAQATEAWEDCAAFQNETAATIRAVKSCSDAVYLRRDVEEADAVCKGADAISAVAADRYQALKADPADKERASCALEHRAQAIKLVAALDWLNTYDGFRLDRHKTPLPAPFGG